ncbi:Asp23/Gls24 family envelope stress response protein [Anaerococcus sp. NML200574]|uniref:Asp23/Gls24 family envelope stress response protein n=1 Tax=Anaerococcus kampingae TaxID=3115614 RepID=A0ABW9MD54_9FIRM|nr:MULTISPECIES: Asp23/Gls24 family envelope stress response protein [unclassified Anaerococcus]MCW6677878.1 Asp23/Gls24 family envelope stress response protein [Anaerococcus sp. NML200574]
MTENNMNQPFQDEISEYTVSDKVLAKITKKVVDKVDGVLDLQGGLLNSITSSFTNKEEESTSGISINQEERQCIVEASLILEYGKKAALVFKEIDSLIKQEIYELTGIKVAAVKVDIVDVLTKEEFAKKNQDKKEER